MTSCEFREIIKRDPIVFLPIGATEAHGAHLPLSTDSLQPEAISEMLAIRLNGLVAPSIKYGYHSSTKNMAGTIGLEFETLRNLVFDVISSLAKNGINKIVVISGHAGVLHMAALRLACQQAVESFDLKLMLVADYEFAKEITCELGCNNKDGHGGFVETARVLAIRPELVKETHVKGTFIDKNFMIVRNPETCYPQGIVGNPSEASVEVGKRINEYIAQRIEKLVRLNFGD